MYSVKITDKAMKALMKMDKQIARWILAWIEKNLEGTTNPRLKGKGLVGDKSGVWLPYGKLQDSRQYRWS